MSYQSDHDTISRKVQKTYYLGCYICLAFVLFIAYLDLAIFWPSGNKCHYELNKSQIEMLRINFTLSFTFLFIGFNQFIFEKSRINYVFILDLPRSKITAGSKSTLTISALFLILTCMCNIMGVASISEFEDLGSVPLPLGYWLY